MGKRKPPAPRGYDPGGFRFPGSGPFKQQRERFDGDADIKDARGIQPILVGSVDSNPGMAAAAVLGLISRFSRRRHG